VLSPLRKPFSARPRLGRGGGFSPPAARLDEGDDVGKADIIRGGRVLHFSDDVTLGPSWCVRRGREEHFSLRTVRLIAAQTLISSNDPAEVTKPHCVGRGTPSRFAGGGRGRPRSSIPGALRPVGRPRPLGRSQLHLPLHPASMFQRRVRRLAIWGMPISCPVCILS
jgi:hypothetical protein